MAKQNSALQPKAKALVKKIDDILAWSQGTKKLAEKEFAKLARYLAEFENGQLWRGRYKSMNDFVEERAAKFGFSRSRMYQAKWVGTRLGPHMNDAKMEQLGISKLIMLASGTTKGSKPPKELVKKAPELKVEEIQAAVRAARPLNKGEKASDLEDVKVTPFWVTRQDKKLVDKVFELFRRVEGIENRNRIFVHLCEIGHAEILTEQQAQCEERKALPLSKPKPMKKRRTA